MSSSEKKVKDERRKVGRAKSHHAASSSDEDDHSKEEHSVESGKSGSSKKRTGRRRSSTGGTGTTTKERRSRGTVDDGDTSGVKQRSRSSSRKTSTTTKGKSTSKSSTKSKVPRTNSKEDSPSSPSKTSKSSSRKADTKENEQSSPVKKSDGERVPTSDGPKTSLHKAEKQTIPTAQSFTSPRQGSGDSGFDSAFSPDAFASFPSSGDAFSSTQPDSAGAGAASFGAAFGDTSTAWAAEPNFGSSVPTSSTGTDSNGNNNNTFGTGFGSTAFGSNDFDSEAFESAFDSSTPFPMTSTIQSPPKPEKIWDKSPLVDIPKFDSSIKLTLKQKLVLAKDFNGSPIANPLNGNIIFAANRGNKGLYLHEVNPMLNFAQEVAVPVFSEELREKVASKYSATIYDVDAVYTMAAGTHLSSGQTRVRVAAIVDLSVVESSSTPDNTMRVIVVWLWSSGNTKVQYVLSPPSGGDFVYDINTLQVADGLFFVAGSSPKGACVFISKPSVREAWSANFLTGSGNVSAMAVKPKHAYLVIGLTDKSVTVWTYKSALVRGINKTKTTKRWLFPLCRLDSVGAFDAEQPVFPGPNPNNAKPEELDVKDVGYCTDLAWLPPESPLAALDLLAVAHENGFSIFHVALPVVTDESKPGIYSPLPEPTQSTVVSATPLLSPIAVKRWKGRHDSSFLCWQHYGPHTDPVLAVLLHDAIVPVSRILMCNVVIPSFLKGPAIKNRLLACRIIECLEIPTDSKTHPKKLIQSGDAGTVICCTEKNISTVSLTLSTTLSKSCRTVKMGHPVVSSPPGLNAYGEQLLVDAASDKDGILHVFSSVICERQKNSADPTLMDWCPPRRRYWLCRTIVGDTIKSTKKEEAKDEQGFGTSEQVFGGATTEMVCDLDDEDLAGLAPIRIVRGLGCDVCAILYSRALETAEDFPAITYEETVKIALVSFGGDNVSIDIIEGRDIVIFPSKNEQSHGLLLSVDGLAMSHFNWDLKNMISLSNACRPIIGVEANEGFIDCRRIVLFSDGTKLSLGIVGKRIQDGRSCFLSGDPCDLSDISQENWSRILPNIITGRCAWLPENDHVVAVAGLEGDGSGYRNFAIATSSRVLVLSSALTVSAEYQSEATGISTLSPIGSFAVAFSSQSKTHYLCCLDDKLSHNMLASLSQSGKRNPPSFLIAVRPDRLLIYSGSSAVSLVEVGESQDNFLLPTAFTRPVLPLEPLIANAISVGGKRNHANPVLRSVVERFGRKVASITHGEFEGIGQFGAGVTGRAFEILKRFGANDAANWLLTGTVGFDRSANSTVLPPWLPIASKAVGTVDSDSMLHVLSNGDMYLSDYIKSPSQNMSAILPRESDPTAYISSEYALQHLLRGESVDAIKVFDLTGSEQAEARVLQLAMMAEKEKRLNSTELLKSLSGFGQNKLSGTRNFAAAPTSLAALSVSLRTKTGSITKAPMAEDQLNRWLRPLAPSLQRSRATGRLRQRMISEKDVANAATNTAGKSGAIWSSPCVEAKHVWNEGPKKYKENLLLLDSVADWFGRRRPLVIGEEGANAAMDRGEKTLADILHRDDNSFEGKEDDLESEKDDGWVEGVGEGRSDEANLSGYFRMAEGEDEDSTWKSDGLSDLSPYQNKAVIIGDAETVSLQQSSSSVDEGEPGKVKSLYDLVFEKSGDSVASGLVISASRGSSTDIGVLHRSDREARKKCSIEFWYYLPTETDFENHIVLMRRTMGSLGDDLMKVGLASENENVLWELLLNKKGELQFISCGGSVLKSSTDHDDDQSDDGERSYLASFGRWNHVCLVLSSKGLTISECSISLYMKGIEVGSTKASMLPKGYTEIDLNEEKTLLDITKKSNLLFALGHTAGYRMTELRIWACERSADDTQTFLYEYLTAAEQKKKFKVKIGNKNKKGASLGKGLGLAAPKGAMSGSKTGRLAGSDLSGHSTKGIGLSLAPPPKESSFSLKPPTNEPQVSAEADQQPVLPRAKSPFAKSPMEASGKKSSTVHETTPLAFDASFSAFGSFREATPASKEESPVMQMDQVDEEQEEETEDEDNEEDVATTLWDTAIPLSQQIRPSAASALIRGPPATRHYGGNRGGLPDFSGVERFGVGGIAICGSEKTIVFRDNEDPPALTYPIGASGAVVSDQMDDEGSEFLCCFLAKEGRMVVFELRSRTVVVELQMTTKLNFWRFLPPEAAENTLCFMLVTPVGGFHWMPLEESPRPHQVWKRGNELQGKKVVSYEEGGSNGLDGPKILSRVGLVLATKSTGAGTLEGWIVPILGDSKVQNISEDMLGACLCQPLLANDGPFLPQLVTVHKIDGETWVNVLSISEPSKGSLAVGEVEATQIIDDSFTEEVDLEPPQLAMGTFPEALCVSLSNIVVVILRRKGLVAAFELEEEELNLIAQECVDHYVIDAVMRYSAEVGGAEIVMLLSDDLNPKDGRIVSFCFRSAG